MVPKIHDLFQYDTVVSRFGTFSMQGNWLCRNVGNMYILNHEAEPMDITQARNILICKFTISRK